MIRTIIIEDEKPSARRLQRMLKKLNVETNVLLHSVSESIAWFENNPAPELIFADIQLTDGLSFEIFKSIDINSAIIFTTAYDQYAIKAFKHNSIDYLLKPFRVEDLETAIKKYKKQKNSSGIDIEQLLKNIASAQETTFKKRYSVYYGQHIKSIDINDVCCFYSQDKTTYIVLQNAKEYMYDQPLEKIENQVDNKLFFRVNRKYIIAYSEISDMISYSNSRIKIIIKQLPNNEIIVARERVKAFKKWLE
jgi:DNA-binding LytR/AlgR family response regulator